MALTQPQAPLISVIIPAHNSGATLEACLASLAKSTQAPLECIVVDDGSADDTAEIARRHGVTVIDTGGRRGPAFARNQGAARARGDILLFIDSDVLIHADALSRFIAAFQANPEVDAVFGSYDDAPASPNFLSQYKNLQHTFVHQHARSEASTFWSGCGAVRKGVFLAHGGFNQSTPRPAIEDIELGYRLIRDGSRILLDRAILGKHLKRWTAWSLLRTEIIDRGIPWTRLILRDRFMPNDLNLGIQHRASAALALLLAASLVTGPLFPGVAIWAGVCVALLLSIALLNLPFYRFLAEKRGGRFALAAMPVHFFHHFCNAATFLLTAAFCKICAHFQSFGQVLKPSAPLWPRLRSEARPSGGVTLLAGWYLWLAIALALTLGPFLWQIRYFKSPGELYYRLVLALAASAPLLLAAYQLLRRSWLWRYELAAIAAIPVAAALVYEPRAAAVTMATFLACHAVGNAIRKRLGLVSAANAEQIAIGAGIGFGTLFCLLFALGMAGLYYAPVFAILVALPCVLLWKEHVELWRCIVQCHAEWGCAKGIAGPVGAMLLAFAAIFTVMATMVALAPSLAFDILRMHLPSAGYYAAQHALLPVPGLEYAFFPQSVETLMTLGLGLGGQPAAQLLPVVFFALTLLILFQLLRDSGADVFSAFAGVLIAASVPAFHWTGGIGKNDFALAFFILAAIDCWVRWRESANFRWI